MLQELFGGAAVGIIGEGQRTKHSNINSGVLGGSCSSTASSPSNISPSFSPSPSSSTVTAAATPASYTNLSSSATPENLRCPRCDSTNTKFCYYNNYNLTQPRHFCKTCRRYWTKGGALRNVPIGGGCRKNKTAVTSSSSSLMKSTVAGKFKTMAAEKGKWTGFTNNLEQEVSSSSVSTSNPKLWLSAQNPYPILSLLRANQNFNPNSGPMSSSITVKEDASLPAALNTRTLCLDASVSQVGMSNSWAWRENENQQIGFLLSQGGQVMGGGGGAGDFSQRFRSSENYCSPGPAGSEEALVLGDPIMNIGSSSSLTVLDSAPVSVADQSGCWNPMISWAD